MADRIEDGGPAFPLADQPMPNDQWQYGSPGMSLRDWFAGQALNGMGLWMPLYGGDTLSSRRAMDARALWAYEQADAMIAARQKGGA